MNAAIQDQEKQTQQERGKEGPGATDTENEKDNLHGRQRTEDDCGLWPDCSEVPNSSRQRKRRQTRLSSSVERAMLHRNNQTPRVIRVHISPSSDVQQQHTFTHIRDAERQAHPGQSDGRNNHISALLVLSCGLPVRMQLVELWADPRLDPAFTEPWLQPKVIGGKASPTGDALHLGDIIDTASPHLAYLESNWVIPVWEPLRLRGRSTRKWLLNQQKCSLLVTSRTGSALRDGVPPSKVEGARRWCPVLGTVSANLWAGKGYSATNSLGEHTRRQSANHGERE